MTRTLAPHEFLSVVGPTGTGKTALALRLATPWLRQSHPVTVISVDARQIYREFPRLSVSDLAAWQSLQQEFGDQLLHFYNLNSVSIDSDFSFGTLLSSARTQLSSALAAHHYVLVVGGTLVCHEQLRPLSHDHTSVPPDDNVRFAAENMDTPALQQWLERVDAPALAAMNPSDRANPRRLVRKIEIALYRSVHAGASPSAPWPYRQLFLSTCDPTTVDTTALHAHLDARVAARFADPIVQKEVADFIIAHPHWHTDDRLSNQLPLGAAQLAQFLAGGLSASSALSSWQIAEWHYARRQLTFLRRLLADRHADLIDQREILAD
ncbi:hypothetical protein IJJ12_01445 [bacterium]|nr:hypothetical protein [bacterium]